MTHFYTDFVENGILYEGLISPQNEIVTLIKSVQKITGRTGRRVSPMNVQNIYEHH